MGNFICTKFNGSYENNNLLHLGALRLQFSQNSYNNAKSQSIRLINKVENMTARIVGDGYITSDVSVPTTTKEVTINRNADTTIYISNTDCFIDIFPIYNVAAIIFGGSGNGDYAHKKMVNPNILKYCSHLTDLYVQETDASNLRIDYISSPVIEQINASYSSVIGNIDNIKAVGTLGAILINECSDVTGSLDSFLDASIYRSSSKNLYLYSTPNIYKKRSTITALQNIGVNIYVTETEVDEDN